MEGSRRDSLKVRAGVRVGIVLTARMGSERFPGKVMTEIGGKPLLEWIALRLLEAGTVVIATTEEPEDDIIVNHVEKLGLPCYRGSRDDVLKRIVDAMDAFLPDHEFIMRGLGDCPFPEPFFILRAAEVMSAMDADAFFWLLPSWVWPAYGAREFPYRRELWQRMDREGKGDEREHPDLFIHRRRGELRRVYHEAPPPRYFRPHRVEVDYPEDIEMLRVMFGYLNRWPRLSEALVFLDQHFEVASINAERGEKTGPYASYDQEDRHQWARAQIGQPIMMWTDEVIYPASGEKPILCAAGTCFVGLKRRDGALITKEGHVITQGRITCPCGAGRVWHPVSDAVPRE